MLLFQRKGEEACVTGIEEAKGGLQEGFVGCNKSTHFILCGMGSWQRILKRGVR